MKTVLEFAGERHELKPLPRRKPQATLKAPQSGARSVGRKRAEPDTSTYEGRFVARLRYLVGKARLDPDEFAERCDVTRQAVDHWLSGRRVPQVNMLPRIAAALGVSNPRQVLPPE